LWELNGRHCGLPWLIVLALVMVEPMTGIEPAYSAWEVFGFSAAFVDVRHRQSRRERNCVVPVLGTSACDTRVAKN
jgi:hypothetical protein